ncbi:glucose-6-phosphate dehydrogenase [Priestia megaterium]|uniref:Glucose-6-phosphate 1-dehydrogenase n=1 Tax=Priestia megaterium TaxID=1404 RepID=A0A3D8X5U5_PRIMG|nr:glucose-6-phosphate dehydrogenase [Priestia megaterium]MDH3174405.1 glucose-6-phosphate dehydrogenase [Priestia megaterium]RDZ16331.1 glucose-6-phosphate dehydrogenase [Priestia megaterium]
MGSVARSRDNFLKSHSPQALEVDSMTFILFGATGDLAKRKIFPALYNLFLDKKLPPSFSIVGTGRSNWSDDAFQTYVEESVKTFSRRFRQGKSRVKEFLKTVRYHKMDVTNSDGYEQLLHAIQEGEADLNIPENRLFYLSVAPEFVDVIASNINRGGLGSTKGWKRLIIEKPFGHDLQSAQVLNQKLTETFKEEEIYRIDHYLGKPMIQNLEALASANPILQALWNHHYVANVQITASETVGVEERSHYYDQSGAIRDMFQNHMLQMLMMTAMQLPKTLNIAKVRQEKIKIMESLRPLQKESIHSNVIRGQYEAGKIQDCSVIGYKEELGINAFSVNDTFIAVRVWIDHELWKGVPFYLRTGKRMSEKCTRIVIEFKNPLKDLYTDEEAIPNLLVVEISPNEGISLQLNSKNPLNDNKIEPIFINFSTNQREVPEAYELLLFDALQGDSTFFAHWEEVELSWKWVQPILEAFNDEHFPLHFYPAGTMGPAASNQLLKEEGFKWW